VEGHASGEVDLIRSFFVSQCLLYFCNGVADKVDGVSLGRFPAEAWCAVFEEVESSFSGLAL